MPRSTPPLSADTMVDRAVAIALVVNLGWTTWHLGGFVGEAMAVSFPALMLTLALVVVRWLVWRPTGLPVGWWWPLPMLAVVGSHLAGVAPMHGRAWLDGLNWMWLAAGFWCGLHVVREPGARRILATGVALLTIGAFGLALYQRIGDTEWLPWGRRQAVWFHDRSSGPFGVPNTLAAWCLLVAPAALVMAFGGGPWRERGARILAGATALAALVALVLTFSRGGWLAAMLAAGVWILTGTSGSLSRKLVIFVAMMAVIAGGVALGYRSSNVMRQRVDSFVEFSGERTRPMMWSAGWGLFRDAPILGTGGGSFGVLLDRHRPEGFRDVTNWAHNDYLNTLSDYGLVGFAASFGLVGIVAGTIMWRRRDAEIRAGSAAGWTRAAGIGLLALALAITVDFHLKLPGLGLLAALLAAEWTTPRRGDVCLRPPRRPWLVTAIATGVGIFSLHVGWAEARPRFKAESLRTFARSRIDANARGVETALQRERVVSALWDLRRAVALAPDNDQAWSDLSYALAQAIRLELGDTAVAVVEAEAAARRAIALGGEVAEHWLRLGVALDVQNRWEEAGLAFGRAVTLAPTNAIVWYYQAYHFSLRPVARPFLRAALATCLRLDPYLPEGNALRAALPSTP